MDWFWVVRTVVCCVCCTSCMFSPFTFIFLRWMDTGSISPRRTQERLLIKSFADSVFLDITFTNHFLYSLRGLIWLWWRPSRPGVTGSNPTVLPFFQNLSLSWQTWIKAFFTRTRRSFSFTFSNLSFNLSYSWMKIRIHIFDTFFYEYFLKILKY